MAICGVIMAGGEGTRLRPLTMDRPKPLVPVLGQPVMGYALSLLHRHGIMDAAATVCYLPKMMKEAFGRGEEYGVNLKYFEETFPKGTAGSVKMCKGMLTDTFVVLSGDGLTDCDLTKAIAYHKEKKAMATLVLKSVAVPLPYGVVITDHQGRIQRFVEKPDWSQVFSDLVNTGIYILEPEVLDLIPEDGTYDFGRELFPKMVAEGMAVYGYPMEGYWCDIGDQGAYLQAQLDLLQGKVQFPLSGAWQGQALVQKGGIIEDGAIIKGPCYVGERAWIGKGAVLGEGAVIGAGARVAEGARLERTCIWEDVWIDRCASLRGAALAKGSRVEHGAVMEEDTALGAGARLATNGWMKAGAKVWPERTTVPGAVVTQNVVWGNLVGLHFVEDKLHITSAGQVDILAGALLQVLNFKTIALMGNDSHEPLMACMAGAVTSRGGDVLLMGEGTPPMLRTLQRMTGAEASVYIDGQDLYVWGEAGLPLHKAQCKKIQEIYQRQDYPPAFARLGKTTWVQGANPLYAQHLLSKWQGRLTASYMHAVVFCKAPKILELAGHIIRAAGIESVRLEKTRPNEVGIQTVQPWEIGFLLDDLGRDVWVLDRDGMPGSLEQELLSYRGYLGGKPNALFLPGDAPRGVWEMVKNGPPIFSIDQREKDQDAFLQQYEAGHDGLLKTLMIMSLFSKDVHCLRSLMDTLPRGYRVTRTIPCSPDDKGRILRLLSEEAKEKEMGQGLRVFEGEGSALLTPLPQRAAFRITGECRDAEFAKELCGRFADKVSRLANPVSDGRSLPLEKTDDTKALNNP